MKSQIKHFVMIATLISPISVLANQDKICALLEKHSLVDNSQNPRSHELIDISSAVTGYDLIQEVHGYVGTMREIQTNLLEFFATDKTKLPSPQTKALTRSEADYLHRFFKNHPVVGLEQTRKKYDPEGCYGFCFGRATIAHIEALEMGVAPENILKIWVSGPMHSQRHFNSHYKMDWAYHVAAMFKSAEGPWLVVDPFYGKVLTAEQWIGIHQSYAQNNYQLLFQVTDPRRIQPENRDLYSTQSLLSDPQFENINRFHKDYLQDLVNRRENAADSTQSN